MDNKEWKRIMLMFLVMLLVGLALGSFFTWFFLVSIKQIDCASALGFIQ